MPCHSRSVVVDWLKELNKILRLNALGPLCLWQCFIGKHQKYQSHSMQRGSEHLCNDNMGWVWMIWMILDDNTMNPIIIKNISGTYTLTATNKWGEDTVACEVSIN